MHGDLLECSAVGGRWCALWIVVDVVQWVGGAYELRTVVGKIACMHAVAGQARSAQPHTVCRTVLVK